MTDPTPSAAATEQERITEYLQVHWADAVADPSRTPLTIYQVLAVGAVLAPLLRAAEQRVAELERENERLANECAEIWEANPSRLSESILRDQLAASERARAALQGDVEAILHQHMYVRTLQMQPMIGGIATNGVRCACGWKSEGHPNVGFASSQWISHVGSLVGARPAL